MIPPPPTMARETEKSPSRRRRDRGVREGSSARGTGLPPRLRHGVPLRLTRRSGMLFVFFFLYGGSLVCFVWCMESASYFFFLYREI